MKVEIKEVENAIDWTKSQVVVSNDGKSRVLIVTNEQPYNNLSFCGVDLDTGEYFNCLSKQAFKPETKQDFPIKLELTIESEQELCDLWHRMNTCSSIINETASKCIMWRAIPPNILFEVLDELSENLGLKS